MNVISIGAICFGLVIGWVTYRTLRRNKEGAAISDISTVIAAVGGAAVTALFKDDEIFGYYSIGLAIGFFLYFLIGLILGGKKKADGWMMG